MVSKSPGRMTFQKESYIERCKKEGKEPSADYIKMYDNSLELYDARFDKEERRIDNMEYDLLTTDWILEKVRASDAYAQNLYAAMANNGFIKLAVIPILKQQEWSCSWRYAGGVIADMRQEGDYIDWYCSGICGDGYDGTETREEWAKRTGYVPEGKITEEIRKDLNRLGWGVAPDGDWEKFEKDN